MFKVICISCGSEDFLFEDMPKSNDIELCGGCVNDCPEVVLKCNKCGNKITIDV